ncbi:hypothetical protein EJA01_12020, partial [Rhodovulum iodosum]
MRRRDEPTERGYRPCPSRLRPVWPPCRSPSRPAFRSSCRSRSAPRRCRRPLPAPRRATWAAPRPARAA